MKAGGTTGRCLCEVAPFRKGTCLFLLHVLRGGPHSGAFSFGGRPSKEESDGGSRPPPGWRRQRDRTCRTPSSGGDGIEAVANHPWSQSGSHAFQPGHHAGSRSFSAHRGFRPRYLVRPHRFCPLVPRRGLYVFCFLEGRGDLPVTWEKCFWLTLSLSSRQLAAIRRYIRGNPARALWKKAHPDRFRVMPGIRHASLDPALRWSAMGDPTLLASPFRFPVRLTRRLPVEAQEDALAEAMKRARHGMVPVCGFISPAEHELERRLRAEPAARWIKAVPHGLRAGYDPTLEDSRALADGRLLLLSSFSPEVPVSPISRANCEAMNSRILRLCGEAAEPVLTQGTGGLPPRPPTA